MGWAKISFLTLLATIAGICGLASAQAATVVHDQAGLLSRQQKQQIRQTNQAWAKTRQHPQLWVYTYRRLDSPLGGFNYQDPLDTPGNELADRILQQEATRQLAGVTTDGDHQIAVTQRAAKLKKHISFILVYPDNGRHTVLAPSNDLHRSLSDINRTFLPRRLPNNVGTATSAMTFFNRYAPFINKHIAKTQTIKPGLSWGRLSFLVVLPFLLWGLYRFFRHPVFLTDDSLGTRLGEEDLWRTMNGSHDFHDHYW